jgi:hypothetical protein
MEYTLESNVLLFEIDRAEIVDISTGDVINISCLPEASYTWTDQDSQFMESNPDARVFVKLEKLEGNKFKGVGVTVFPQEVY